MDLHSINVTQIIWLVLIVAAVWIVLRFVLKLAGKVFACGCSLLALVAIILIVLRLLGKA